MITKSGNIHVMHCDWCQEGTRGYTDAGKMHEETFEVGWRSVKIQKKWHELCPECFGKIEKIEVE